MLITCGARVVWIKNFKKPLFSDLDTTFIQREFSPFKMLAKNNFFRRNQRERTCEKDDDEEIARIFSAMKLDIPFSFYDSISFK